jgi:hypothetical protein
VIRAGQVIPSVLAEVIRKAPLCDEKVTFAWRAAAGPAFERVTTVRLDADGVLHVTAADAHWALEVKRARKIFAGRLAPLLGADAVKRIEVAKAK